MLYVTRDVGKDTADRVAWTEGVNLPVDDGPTCGKLMRRTVNDAAALKAAAGAATTGRKLRKPIEHLTLSWSPDERPTRREMRAAALEAIEVRGYRGCQAFIACHTDRDHPHVHIVICRVDPKTGRARKPTHTRKLQRWAENYEERTGGIRIPNRRERRLVREHNGREIRAAVKEERQPALRRMPAMETKRSRGPNSRAIRKRTVDERRQWSAILAEQERDTVANPAQARAERVALARRQSVGRLDAGRHRAERSERLAAAAAVPPVKLRPVPERPRVDLAHVRIEAPAPVPSPVKLRPVPERPRVDLAHVRIEAPAPVPSPVKLRSQPPPEPTLCTEPAPEPEPDQDRGEDLAAALTAATQFRRACEEARDLDIRAAAEGIPIPRGGVPWDDVAAELETRQFDVAALAARYTERRDLGHGVDLDIGTARESFEAAMVDYGRTYRRPPGGGIAAAVGAVVDAIQTAVDAIVSKILDQVLPKQVRDTAPAAAQESATAVREETETVVTERPAAREEGHDAGPGATPELLPPGVKLSDDLPEERPSDAAGQPGGAGPASTASRGTHKREKSG